MGKFTDRVIAISGESLSARSFAADQVCTFQVHSRRRVAGRLKPMRSKSITAENISLKDGFKIIRLGIELFEAARENGTTILHDGSKIVRLGIDAFKAARE